MIRRFSLLLIIFFSITSALFARGKAEESEIITHNDEWILCITDFDAAELAFERRAVAGVVMRQLVEIFNTINFHSREDAEYAYYEESAWHLKRLNTAKTLAGKQNERSLLLFRGEPDWRYRNEIAKLDAEIEKLVKMLEEIDNNAPVINRDPVFRITSGNLEFRFPAAPAHGSEHIFCSSQNADAFLAGSVSDYHGRFLLSLKLYTVYSRSYAWEDRIIFSHGDIDTAIEEITHRLVIMLSGNSPGAVVVNAQPEESLVLINRAFAGRGDTGVLEYPPGRITVTASAPNYESVAFETELVSGEITQISINLKPVEYGELEITGNHAGLSGSIYHGAMYMGEAPLTLLLPVNFMEYLEIKTFDGNEGSVIFQTPGTGDFFESVNIRTARPPRHGQVDRARRWFYWSFGGTWLAGIASWVSYHTYNTMVIAYNQGGVHNQKLYDDAVRMGKIRNGALIAAGAFAVLDIILLVRYIYVANRGSAQVRTGGN